MTGTGGYPVHAREVALLRRRTTRLVDRLRRLVSELDYLVDAPGPPTRLDATRRELDYLVGSLEAFATLDASARDASDASPSTRARVVTYGRGDVAWSRRVELVWRLVDGRVPDVAAPRVGDELTLGVRVTKVAPLEVGSIEVVVRVLEADVR